MALRDRAIDLGGRALLELPLEIGVRRLALGHDHQPGRADVESVDNALPLGSTRCRDAVARRSETADHGGPVPAGARMRGDAHGLVDDDDVVVVVDDAHALDRLGLARSGGFRKRDLEPGAGDEAIGLAGGAAVDAHRARGAQVCRCRAREAEEPGQADVDALPREPFGHRESADVRHRR